MVIGAKAGATWPDVPLEKLKLELVSKPWLMGNRGAACIGVGLNGDNDDHESVKLGESCVP